MDGLVYEEGEVEEGPLLGCGGDAWDDSVILKVSFSFPPPPPPPLPPIHLRLP